MFAGDTLTDATAGARNILFIHCLGVAFVAVSNGSRVEIDVGVLFLSFFLSHPACLFSPGKNFTKVHEGINTPIGGACQNFLGKD